jgi:hypothetical protein
MKNTNMVTNHSVPGRFPLADLVYMVETAPMRQAQCASEVANEEDWAREYVHGIPSVHGGINS